MIPNELLESRLVQTINDFKGQHFFLSNFYVGSPFSYGTFQFQTGEHLFNALKTKDFNEAVYVVEASTPGEAKSRGRRVTLRENWDETVRFEAMRTTVGAKFLGSPSLQTQLLVTGDALLVEGNTWHDNVWGDCLCNKGVCIDAGQNHLGKILMELRADLQKWS